MVLTPSFKKHLLRLIEWLCILINTSFVLLVLYICTRVFLVESYSVPSNSMYPAIVPGDCVWVFKPTYGGRLLERWYNPDFDQLKYYRWKGLREVRRNDVVVINRKKAVKTLGELFRQSFYIKRCIALPGDTLRAVNGFYRVSGYEGVLGDEGQQQRLSQMNPANMDEGAYRLHGGRWNIQNFGPLYLPKKGDTLPMDSATARLYHTIISRETGKPMRMENGTIFLGNTPIKQYNFTENYYFFGGDNVIDSNDSRYWGLIGENEIVAKAWRVWYSEDPYTQEVRWERIFKRIE